MKESKPSLRVLGLCAAVVLFLLSRVLPLPAGLSRAGLSSLALLASAIFMWICRSLPESLTCLLMVCVASWFDIANLSVLLAQIASPSFFFIMATFAISAAIDGTTLPQRFVDFIMRLSGGRARLIILGTILGCGFLASIMSHIAAAALFASLGLGILKECGAPEPGSSNFARGLMIGVGYGAGIGGFLLPLGTVNILAVELIRSSLGLEVSFLGWMCVGIPIWLIGSLIVWLSIILCFPPERAAGKPRIPAAVMPALTAKEKKALGIVGAEFLLWILGSWVPALDSKVVAMAGMICMFLPGVDVLSWSKYSRCVNWNTVFFVGSVSALIYCLTTTEAAGWLAETLASRVDALPAPTFFVLASVLGLLCHSLVPTGSGVFLMLGIPLTQIAVVLGIPAVPVILIVAFWAGLALLLPFDAVPMLTYEYGYYTVADMCKCAAGPAVALILMSSTLIPWLSRLVL